MALANLSGGDLKDCVDNCVNVVIALKSETCTRLLSALLSGTVFAATELPIVFE